MTTALLRSMTWAALALTLALLVGACSHSAETDRLARLRAAGLVRVGITGTSPPWTLFDKDHRPAGYDVAVAREIARRIGISEAVFVPDAFKNFVEGLKTDKYDLVLNDLSPTPQRAEQVDFGRPYGVEDFRLFVREDDGTIQGLEDLKGKVVGVTTGTNNETWARAHIPGAEVRGYDNGSLIFRDLSLGRIDAVLISHFGGLRYAQANGLAVREASAPLTYQVFAPAMAKDQPELKAAVDRAIGDMIADGTIDRLAAEDVGVDYKMSDAIGLGEREAAAERKRTGGGDLVRSASAILWRSLPLLGPALLTTLSLGFTSFILGSVLGLGIALARIARQPAVRALALAYLSIFRGTPLLVQLLLIYFGLPETGLQVGPIPAAVTALTLFSAAYLSEDFRAGIRSVDRGQWEASIAMGMDHWLSLRRVILPQGLLTALPSSGSRLIALMKDTSLASAITVVELTRVADEVGASTFRYVEAFIMVGGIYWLINQTLTVIQLVLEHRMSRHLR